MCCSRPRWMCSCSHSDRTRAHTSAHARAHTHSRVRKGVHKTCAQNVCGRYLSAGSVPSSMSREEVNRPRWVSILRKVRPPLPTRCIGIAGGMSSAHARTCRYSLLPRRREPSNGWVPRPMPQICVCAQVYLCIHTHVYEYVPSSMRRKESHAGPRSFARPLKTTFLL